MLLEVRRAIGSGSDYSSRYSRRLYTVVSETIFLLVQLTTLRLGSIIGRVNFRTLERQAQDLCSLLLCFEGRLLC